MKEKKIEKEEGKISEIIEYLQKKETERRERLRVNN